MTLAYHARTKHHLERYAAGPETLDWDMQPNPFREFAGCARIPLSPRANELDTGFAQVYEPEDMRPFPLTIAAVSVLIELSMGLSAWKEYGPDRWALRCNPSSGNLHPTEAYLLCQNITGLDNGLYHYVSRDHVLEGRYRSLATNTDSPRLWIGLSSVHWREAWKYGERAFRYCQLDIGHAIGAVRYAAGALGWSARIVESLDSAEVSAQLGLDRAKDFSSVEAEHADLLIAIDPVVHSGRPEGPRTREPQIGQWAGQANRLDPHPMYRWPVIDQVEIATRGSGTDNASTPPSYPSLPKIPAPRAAEIILGRRSAQRFDSKFRMSADAFYRLLDCLLARPIAPWDVWSFAPRVHPIFFVHRVEGLEPGLYAMPRRPDAEQCLRDELRSDFQWQRPDNTPAHLPFVRLLPSDCRAFAKTVSCHQAIASDGCFSLSMLSEFESIVRHNAWRYRQLHWEAGLIGHALYLEAEAAGLRGTGIGCYFDDAVHEALGIKTRRLQALYHFTVGRPLTDNRITTLPAYSDRP